VRHDHLKAFISHHRRWRTAVYQRQRIAVANSCNACRSPRRLKKGSIALILPDNDQSPAPPSADITGPGAFWDARFGVRPYVYGTEPNAFLVRQRYILESGMNVLSIADGEGRNGVWMAQQGMRVSTVDASAEGVKKALRLALDRGVALNATCADLTTWVWPQQAFDAVVLVFLHLLPEQRQQIHQCIINALKPGGLLLMEVFRPQQLDHHSGGPRDAALLYTAAMLQDDFAALDILDLQEATPELDEGPFHQGPAATLQLVARRPLAP
jgi:2-polyprenyl-3-methyl-5-hydroxy-6-metoxy-1,4-benzoquinol methylase